MATQNTDDLLPLLSTRLSYCPVTGAFHWLGSPESSPEWNSVYAGKMAGSIDRTHGYRRISVIVDGKTRRVQAHRLAYFKTHGVPPTGAIDHINGDRTDNRAENLREATPTTNGKNRRKNANNTSGFNGVYYCKETRKWRAYVASGRKTEWLGYYSTAEEAAQISHAARAARGYTARHGVST